MQSQGQFLRISRKKKIRVRKAKIERNPRLKMEKMATGMEKIMIIFSINLKMTKGTIFQQMQTTNQNKCNNKIFKKKKRP